MKKNKPNNIFRGGAETPPTRSWRNWLFAFFLLIATGNLFAQTTLISPTVNNGGFESGTSGWTFVNSSNAWAVGTAAVPFAGTNSVYVSNTGGTTYAYDNLTISTSHFYRDVTIPSGETDISLTFQHKGFGESGWDRLLVYCAPTSVTPVIDDPIPNSTTLAGATLVYTAPMGNNLYGLVSVTVPPAFAGTTMRLIFTWQGDDSFGSNPPSSVDDITLISNPGPAIYYSKAAATNFASTASWGSNADGSGTSPASINSNDSYVIRNGSNMVLNANASVRNLTIEAGTLTISANTLNVTLPSGNTALATVLTGGTLTVSGGTLNINGRFEVTGTAAFNQSGGNINIDGNDGGIGATSVPGGTAIVLFTSSTLNLTGGTFTIVDPHASSTASLAFNYNTATAYNSGAGHTFRFGNGVSTDPGGNATNGFRHNTWFGSGRFLFGQVVVDALSGTNRYITSTWSHGMRSLNIISGEYRTTSSPCAVEGDITNNGILTANSTLQLSTYLGGTSAASTVAQTISGSGIFRNSPTASTANFTGLTVINSNPAGVTFANANSVLSGSNTGTVSGTLTLTAGTVNSTVAPFILGVSTTTNGTLAATPTANNGGFGSGTTFRRWTSTTSTTVIPNTFASSPTSAPQFPFVINGQSRRVYMARTANFGSAGWIQCTYNDVAGLVADGFSDAGYPVQRRTNANWTFATGGGLTAGTGSFSLGVSGEGLLILAAAPGTAPRLIQVGTAAATHVAGTGTTTVPIGNRNTLTLAQITGSAHYLGVQTSDLGVTTIASGAWESPSTWSTGAAPTAGQNPVILGPHAVTVNGAAAVANNLTVQGTLNVTGNTLTIGGTAATGLDISSSGIVTISGGTVDVGPQDNSFCNRTTSVSGSLTVSSGSLNIAGNLLVNATGTLNQSGGNINVDGNAAANAANSVASGTAIVTFNSSNINFTGGTMTIVDPHANTTASESFRYNTGASANSAITHTMNFGNGVSTDAGGNATNGFRTNTWVGSGRFLFGNLNVNMNGGTNRFITHVYSHGIRGNFTINSGSEYRSTVLTYVAGNLTNNGTLATTAGLYFGNFLGGVASEATVAQTVGGSGTFQNTISPAPPTANIGGAVTFNNTNAGGITLNVPLTQTGGGVTFVQGRVINSVSNPFTHIKVGVGNQVFTSLPTTAGYITGPFRVTFPASLTNATSFFPTGETGANWLAFFNVITNAGGPVTIEVSGDNTLNAPTAFGPSLTGVNLGREWNTSILSGAANLTSFSVQAHDASIVSGDALAAIKSPATQFEALGSGSTFVAAGALPPGLALNLPPINAVDFPDRITTGTTGPLDVSSMSADHPELTDVVPGATNQRILRLNIPALGSSGTVQLTSIKFTYAGSTDADIAANGVKFWRGSFTAPTVQIGTGQSFIANETEFTGLSENISSGNNWFWVTYDLAPTATIGNNIDCSILTGDASFSVGGGATAAPPLPTATVNPAGVRLIGYCVPTYTSGCGAGDEITNVNLAGNTVTLNNASGCTPLIYYTFYSAAPKPDIEQGSSYTVSVTMGADGNQYAGVWIDFNKNGVFETSEYFSTGTNAGASGTSNINITVPGSASLGITRMRVRGGNDAILVNTQACGASSSGFGESEDYEVNITSPSPAGLGTISATHTETTGMGVATTNNNIMRVNIPQTGSLGGYTLNQIRFTYTGTAATDIAASGVTLWTGTISAPVTQIGSAVSLSGGQANFTGLSQALVPGNNFLWLRVNTSASAVINNIVDFNIAAGDITLTETAPSVAAGTQPAALIDPAGSRFIDYCTAGTVSGGAGDNVTNVNLVGNTITLNNASGLAASPFYTFFNAAPKPDLFRGATYNLSVTMGTDGSQFSAVWVDFNNNGVFETSEYFSLGTNAGASGTSVIPVTVPPSAFLGDVRMRVRGGSDNAYNNSLACGILAAPQNWGEVEDYIVTLVNPPACVSPLPSAGATTASSTTVCAFSNVSFNITGTMPVATGITYQLRRNGVNLGSSVTALPINQLVTLSGNYDIVVTCSAGPPSSISSPIAITANAPTVTPGSGVTRCGTGTANLTATFGGGATALRWFDAPTAGNLIGTGSPFTTPSVSSTTTFYVESTSPGAAVNGAKLAPTGVASTSAFNYGLVFDATETFNLNSVDVYPVGSSGTVTIQVQDNLGTPLPGLSGTYAFPATTGLPHTIALNFVIPQGTGYRLIATTSTAALVRDVAPNSFPFALGTAGSVTGGYIAGPSATYYYFYNWSVTPICVSPRSPITVTVNTPPAVTLSSSSATICEGTSTAPVSITAPSPTTIYNTYTWSPATGVSGGPSGPFTFNPTVSTSYTLTATQTSGPLCVNTTGFTVNVNPSPVAGTANASPNPLCQGTTINLTAPGFTTAPSVVVGQNFESGLGSWTINANSIGGSNPALGNFRVVPHGVVESAITFNSPGGTNFAIANSDAQGNGGTTNTAIVSPVFSLASITAPSLTFRHFYDGGNFSGGEIGRVQLSTDGGATWTVLLASYTSAQGTETSFAPVSISLAPYIGQTNLRIRFFYQGAWDYQWAVDDIAVSASSLSYAWTGPNSYSASTQSASVPTAAPVNSGVYTVTATNTSGCTATASTATVTVNGTPTASVSGSAPHAIATTNCAVTVGTSKSALNTIEFATATNGTISWSEDGAGSISSGGSTTTPTYTPAAGDAGNLVTLTMTVTPPAPCTPVTATYVIDFRPVPTISIDDPSTICTIGNPFRVLTVTSPIEPNTEYTWPANDLYLDPAFTIPYVAGTSATTVYSVPFGSQVYFVTARNVISNCAVQSAPITVNVCPALTQDICDADLQPTIPVTTTATFTQYNLVGATPSALPTGPACGMPSVDLVRDIFYRVTVPASGELHVVTRPGNNPNAALNVQRTFLQILTGASCTSTSIQGCDRGGAAGLHSYAYATGLTPGNTAYIRIASVANVYNSAAGASNVGATVTVGSTSGLIAGMTVSVIAGTGSFPANTTVVSVLNGTQFVASAVPTGLSGTSVIKGRLANVEQTSVAVSVTDALVWSGASGNNFYNPANYLGGDATSLTFPAGNKTIRIVSPTTSPVLSGDYVSSAGASSSGTTVTVSSTSGLVAGMVVRVTAGSGSFTAGTTVQRVVNGTDFIVNIPPVGLSGSTIITGSPAVRSLIMSGTGNINVTAASSLGVFNNITGVSTASILGTGYVELRGIAPQTINFNNGIINYLRVNNPSAVNLTSTLRAGGVQLQQGNLSSSGFLTILSTTSINGFIDNFSPGFTGSVSGNVRVQRRAVSTLTANHMIATPVTNTLTTVGQYNDNFPVVGSPAYTFTTDPGVPQPSPFPTVWYFDESLTGPFTPGWRSATGVVPAPGQGINAFIPTTRTFDALGTANTGPYTRSVTFTDDGFNLVGNPYPSSINFNNLYAANSSVIQNGFYIWNDQVGNYAVYNGATNTWTNGGGNTGGTIGHSQGFFVVATGAGTVSFDNTMRTTTNPVTFFEESSDIIRLSVKNAGRKDETVLAVRNGASDKFDFDFDSRKFLASQDNVLSIFTVSDDNAPLAVNVSNEFNTEKRIPLQVVTLEKGEVTISLDNINVSGLEAVILEDAVLNKFIDLKSVGKYTLNLSEGNSGSRFFLHFGNKSEAVSAIAANLMVYSHGDKVFVNVPEEGNTQIEIMNMLGQTISTENVTNLKGLKEISVPNVVTGTYLVKVTNGGKVTTEKVVLTGK